MILAACLLVIVFWATQGEATQNQTAIYVEQGGNTMHVGSGGDLQVEGTGTVTFDTTVMTGTLSWLTSSTSASATHSLGSTDYAALLEPTAGVTGSYISDRSANTFTASAGFFPSADVSQRYFLIPGERY